VQTLNDIDLYRGRAQDIAREHGMDGGACVFHPWRVKESVKEEIPGDERGQWRYVRESDEPWREQVYWSPHWHIVGPCADFAADGQHEDWTVRRLSSTDRMESLTDAGTYEGLAGMVRYVLSHLGYEIDAAKDGVTWFGAIHPTQFVPDEEISEGAFAVIERMSEQVVGNDGERDTECDCEDCTGEMLPICKSKEHLQRPGWCQSISDEAERRLTAAREWIIGEIEPPPGLRHPSTPEEAEESLDQMLG